MILIIYLIYRKMTSDPSKKSEYVDRSYDFIREFRESTVNQPDKPPNIWGIDANKMQLY
jgi:hypothetical protein